MFEQDYIMRIIHEVIRMAMKLLCGVDIDEPEPDILEDREERDRLWELMRLADSGEINKAENALFDALSAGALSGPLPGLLFYDHLNKKDDAFLEAHDFSREEVREGLSDLLRLFDAGELPGLLERD